MTPLQPFLLILLAAACATTSRPDRRAPDREAVAAWAEAREALRAGDEDRGLKLLEVAVRADPHVIAAHRAYQDLERARGLGHVMLERYRDALGAQDDRAPAWYLYGRLRGDLEGQEAAFRRAIRLDPTLSWGHHGLGAVLWRRGDLDGAGRSLRRAAGLAPAESAHWLAVAGLERERGDADAAERAARMALAVDPREPAAWGVLADLREGRGDGPGAIAATRRGLELGRGSSAWRHTLGRRVRAFGSGATIRAALAAELVRQKANGPVLDGLVEIGLYRLRLGDLEGGGAALTGAVERGVDPRLVVRSWRRALVRAGRFDEAVHVDGMAIPARFRQGEGNELTARWERLRAAAAAATGDPEDGALAADLGDAMVAVGWLEEACAVLRRALVVEPGNERVRRALGRAHAFRTVIDRLADALARGYQGGEGPAADLDALLARAGEWLRRAGLAGSPAEAERVTYLLVGEIVDGSEPGRSALHDRLFEAGHLLVLGQRSGASVEALLGEAVSLERDRRARILGRELVHDRLVIANLSIGTHRGAMGDGDPSGLAMEGFDLLNLDAVSPRPYRASGMAEVPLWRPSDPRDRRSIDWPGDVLGRLAARLPPRTRELRLDVVACHEMGHLLDAERYLPVHAHPIRGLALVLSAGLSAREVQGRLEGNAQLVAVAAAREPRAALYEMIAIGTRRDVAPPHSLGYHDALRELVDEIADDPERYPEIDPEANVLQQMDRLEPDEIRDLARRLLTRRDLP